MMQWMSTEKIGKADRVYGKETTMEELYFTIAGCSHYFGSDFMEKGMKVKLEKEPDLISILNHSGAVRSKI